MISIVIPAHNEARVLGRLLKQLSPVPGDDIEFDIVVVANGCTDLTAAIARGFPVRVIETPVASKAAALALGDEHARGFPRFYVDGDIELSRDSVRMLADALATGVHAVAPARHIDVTGVSWPVRVYYDVWRRLPTIEHELFGRGVVAVDEVGHERLLPWPSAMADDLRATLTFEPHERAVVDHAVVTIRPPKTYRDLLSRRTRAMTGNRLLAVSAEAPPRRAPTTSVRQLIDLVVREPRTMLGAAVFVATALLAKAGGWRRARRNDTHWLRDESSRV